MDATFYEGSLGNPVKVEVAPTAIVKDTTAAPTRAAPPPTRGFLRPLGSEQLNSRLTYPLPAGKWTARWQANLDPDGNPLYLLWSGDRILVQGMLLWELLDRGGKPIVKVGVGKGELAIDEARNLFYAPDPSGMISARKLADGSVDFRLTALMPAGFFRRIYLLGDGRLGLYSSEMQQMAKVLRNPEVSTLEVIDIGNPPQVDDQHTLTSARPVGDLLSRTMPFLAAFTSQGAVVAVQDHLFVTDAQLKIIRDLKDHFIPLAMSLDEAGRIHLILRDQQGIALWVMDQNGKRAAARQLGAVDAPIAPVIGFDHCVYVVNGDGISAIEPDGKVRWEKPLGGRLGGLAVTRDDKLLASVGADLVAFNAKGERQVLFSAKGDQLVTGPILTDREELLVASKTKLYCLGRGD